MSNNRQKSAHQPPTTQVTPPSQSTSTAQASSSCSQIEATFSTLQLPIAASTATNTLSTSAGAQASQSQANAICQSVLYRVENNTQFSRAKAILWEIKFIISNLVSKKNMPQATNDLQSLSEQFGQDFDKYLIRELLEQIDLKDANKPSRDRTEPVKCLLMNEELKRICEKPDFLTYFDELSRGIFGESRNKEFLKEICSRLKLTAKMALMIALSLHESSLTEADRVESASLVKQKLIEYHTAGSNKAEALEEYALHRLLYIFRVNPEFENSAGESTQFEVAKRFLIEHHQIKPCQHVALRLSLAESDLISLNPTLEDPANSLIRLGSGLNHLSQASKLLEPWEVLIDLGHYSSFNYQMLSNALQDFKDINEKTMANMLLHLAVHYSGQDDLQSRIVFGLFEVNKTGDASSLKKEPSDKLQQMQWHIGHFSRAFRENYSNLNWNRILESFAELQSEESELADKFNDKAFSFFLQLFSKSKPQNLQVPITLLLDQRWQNSNLQLKFITNAIQAYVNGEDKTTFTFSKCQRKIGQIADLPDAPQALIDVWSSPEVAQVLLNLSETSCYTKVRHLFDYPVQNCPAYLLLALSQVQVDRGSMLLDELVSILMTNLLQEHPQSQPVLKKLWDLNQHMMIRAIAELCSSESLDVSAQLNTNKVLDITQDIKDSLIKFVKCQDYDFAVALGIIAGKRDFLNYDAWLRERITTVGNQFLRSLVRYFFDNVFKPIQEQLIKNNLNFQSLTSQAQPNTQEQDEKASQIIDQVLEKAHLTKSRLTLTVEVLQTHINEQASSQQALAENQTGEDYKLVMDLMQWISILVPRQPGNSQQSETEKAANQYFELVFNAEPNVVEYRISEFINKIRGLSSSSIQRDREILYCILNTFYEEYRFILSFRDRKNLISFAKLFGGIINKNIIEDTLMEISIKFIIQALQNNDNRLTFGIEALKQSYQCLSDFPRQFKEIYQLYEAKIKEQDPGFHAKFVKFYNLTFSTATPTVGTPAPPAQRSYEETADTKEETSRSAPRSAGKQFTDTDILSQGDVQENDTQKLQLARQKDRGESQKANAKTSDQRNSFANFKPQTTGAKNQASSDKRKSPDHPASAQSTSQPSAQSGQPQSKGDKDDKALQNQSQPFSGQGSSILPGGLNIQSEAFNRLPEKAANPAQAQGPTPTAQKPSINVNAMTFNPTEVQPFEAPTKQYTQPIEVQAWQENIDRKINDAKAKRIEIRFEDLIEDPLLKQISPDAQKEIRFICNNTGTSTFDSQLEKAQNLLQGVNAEINLNWFLHYFLIQRLLTVPQLNIYIELFKKLGNNNVVSKSIKLSVDIMKRCMLIPEEEFNKVMKRSSSQTNIIRQFLQQLGTFIGILTLASNRPIYSTEVDLKQMLIEGFQQRNRYVIIFVCRILREAPKSQIQIFNRSNPWILSLLEILREIYDPQKQGEETQTEIQLLFKEFGLGIHEFQTPGFLKARMTNQLTTFQQQAEAIFYDKKELIIPMRVVAQSEASQPQTSARGMPGADDKGIPRAGGPGAFEPTGNEEFDNELRRHNNQQQIFHSVVITPNPLFRTFKISENDYRKVISEALEQSIKEILPPVVTRSVSIALITTKQLVLKDFTYDSDIQKVTDAINQFAKNSAGSLALVTCREPLRISLKEYLKKEIEQCCFKFGTKSGLTNGEELRIRDQSEATQAEADEMDQRLSQYIQENEDMISEVANNASQENLELGCNIIKNTVFDDTAKRIWQDEDISFAMERRRIANQEGRPFVDEHHVANFVDLPEILRPNVNGLTQGQLRVYSDFSKLNQRQRVDITANLPQMPIGQYQYTGQDRGSVVPQFMPEASSGQRQAKEPSTHPFTLDAILADVERLGSLNSFTRALLTLKLQEISKAGISTDNQVARRQQDTHKSLWRFTEKKFLELQMCFDGGAAQSQVTSTIEILALIVKKFKVEDFSRRLLIEVFLNMEEMYLFNVELNIALLGKGILTLAEWDKQFAIIIRDAPGNLQEKVVQFLNKFISFTILNQQIQTMKADKIPCLLKEAKSLSLGSDSQSQQLKAQLDKTIASLQEQEQTDLQKQLKSFFLQWVEISYITDTAAQEHEMNTFFGELRTLLQIERDQTNLFEFCNVSIRTSIDLSRQTQSGELRESNALLNYHFIDSFIKLVVLLLKAFEFNKQEFMSKILEFIRIKLDQDHTQQQKQFNQKPYHRMLINILTAVNISDCFNQRTQRQILFDMADLLQHLKPTSYPAFAFAWLELISHRLFMPHFIKRQDPTQNQAWFQIKDLLVSCFTFLKHNMIAGQKSSRAIQAFYSGTIRIVLLILKDYPDFLCDFHFNFVNSLPDHAIQLKNMILAAVPRQIQAPDPLTKDLRLDITNDVKEPRILSNYEAYLSVNNLKEDLDNYFKSKKFSLIKDICQKMMDSKEKINGKEIPSSAVINAAVLYITQQTLKDRRNKDDALNYNDLFQQITDKLNDETRIRFLNSIVNELRYPNSHTYCSCLLLNALFMGSEPHIQEQIQRILFERLQSHRPHPWGLSINFRELIQNRLYGFMTSPFMKQNKTVDLLFQNRLRPFDILIEEQKSQQQQQQQRPHLE